MSLLMHGEKSKAKDMIIIAGVVVVTLINLQNSTGVSQWKLISSTAWAPL